MTIRTRFAPSPTGYLHLGHAFSALTAYGFARDMDGEFILRIEDIDHTRCRPAFEQAIYEDLNWLGVTWETPNLRQSDHLSDYQAALDQLRDLGVLYADSRTRKGQAEAALSAPQGEDTAGAAPAAPAWRLSLEAARRHLGARYDDLAFTDLVSGAQPARPEVNGDVILGRKDIGVAYHLAVVIDDARQNISHVVRGSDLFDATHTQVLLQALLDLPTPQYLHHALLLDGEGRRLAKRKGSKSLRDYRAEGLTAADINEIIAQTPRSVA
ncbi:tRNA glutamyl-Q(34) synthetase GluQRS [Asticcacaulis sp. AC402]|uniref:tRNA glutamyl-Q(34) synthetase GluQRS n=1 Tax=Asticcacaulis sp. AC402 TaxID=1282361 RepID=UPI0003C3EE94|nr:tRNA glutamyl-Q(34) synthetase GluQRS [Asticcacaulis sp. AC402]ESQ76658.1 glutamyl-tRNA synthetase [Asticcacaulis sp. AC402]